MGGCSSQDCCQSYIKENDNIVKELEKCNITRNDLYKKNNDLETQLYSCKNTNYNLKAQLYSCNNTNYNLETQLYSCNNNVSDWETQLYSCKNNANDLEKQLYSCNNTNYNLSLLLNKYINKNNNLELYLRKLENEIIQNKNIIESKNSEIEKLKKEINTNQKKEFFIDIGLGLFLIIIIFAFIFVLCKFCRQKKRIQNNKNEKIISKEVEYDECNSDED